MRHQFHPYIAIYAWINWIPHVYFKCLPEGSSKYKCVYLKDDETCIFRCSYRIQGFRESVSFKQVWDFNLLPDLYRSIGHGLTSGHGLTVVQERDDFLCIQRAKKMIIDDGEAWGIHAHRVIVWLMVLKQSKYCRDVGNSIPRQHQHARHVTQPLNSWTSKI